MTRQIETRTGLGKNSKKDLSQAAENLLSSLENAKQVRLYAEWGTGIWTRSNGITSRDHRLRAEGKQAMATELMLRRAITVR